MGRPAAVSVADRDGAEPTIRLSRPPVFQGQQDRHPRVRGATALSGPGRHAGIRPGEADRRLHRRASQGHPTRTPVDRGAGSPLLRLSPGMPRHARTIAHGRRSRRRKPRLRRSSRAGTRNPRRSRASIIGDLHWLIHQGHVIEFANGGPWNFGNRQEAGDRPEARPSKPCRNPRLRSPPEVEGAPAGSARNRSRRRFPGTGGMNGQRRKPAPANRSGRNQQRSRPHRASPEALGAETRNNLLRSSPLGIT